MRGTPSAPARAEAEAEAGRSGVMGGAMVGVWAEPPARAGAGAGAEAVVAVAGSAPPPPARQPWRRWRVAGDPAMTAELQQDDAAGAVNGHGSVGYVAARGAGRWRGGLGVGERRGGGLGRKRRGRRPAGWARGGGCEGPTRAVGGGERGEGAWREAGVFSRLGFRRRTRGIRCFGKRSMKAGAGAPGQRPGPRNFQGRLWWSLHFASILKSALWRGCFRESQRGRS